MSGKVDTVAIFNTYELTWKIQGLRTGSNTTLIRFYDVVVTIFVAFGQPLHLVLGSLQAQSIEEFFSSLVINVASVAILVKLLAMRIHLSKMDEIKVLLAKLDKNVKIVDDCQSHRKEIVITAKRLTKLYFILYYGVVYAAVAVAIQKKQRSLIFYGSFPFDWKSSAFKYFCAVTYQFVAGNIQNAQNIACDGFGSLALCALSGHIELLGMRTARVGKDETKSEKQHNAEFNNCAYDFYRLMCITRLIEKTISWSTFAQIIAGTFNICACVVTLVFYAHEPLVYIANASVLIGVCIQMFPACYYGSILEIKFANFPYAIFSCNWNERQMPFRRSVIVLSEYARRPMCLFAGGMIKIHLGTFFAALKMSYSLFCVILDYDS